MACISMGTWNCTQTVSPTASLKRFSPVSCVSMVATAQLRPGMPCRSYVPTTPLSLSSTSPFSGFSGGLGLNSNVGLGRGRSCGLVVKAIKYQSWQTKRNKSRKSLARVHGFRKRMSTTSGRAVLKRRRAKGRWVLCPKSNPNGGKRP